ncbi:MAG: polysaccharide biosynthesis tyrosine autokinase [Sphingomonadales bacterium]
MNKSLQVTQNRPTSPSQEEPEISLEDIFNIFKRRKGILVSTIALLMGLTALVVFQLPKEYTAEVLMEIEPQTNNVLDPLAILSGLPMDTETILTEIEILRSRSLRQNVVEELNLTRDPEFNPDLAPGSLLGMIPFLSAGEGEEQPYNVALFETIEELGEKIKIANNGLSRTINISVQSEDPEKATLIANTLSEQYLTGQLEAKFDEIERTSIWLTDRLSDLEVRVQSSDQAVEEYRNRNGLFTGKGNVSATAEQISSLNIEIILARSERAQAEAKLKNVQNLLDTQEGVGSVGDVLDNNLIQSLKEQEAELLRNMAANQERYGPKHPVMIQGMAAMKDLKRKVELEVEKIILGLRGDVGIARVREQTLETELEKLEGGLAEQNTKEIQLRQLQREADTNKTLYEDFLASFKTVAGQQGIQSTDARVISAAAVPTDPSHPKIPLILAAALLVSGIVGVGLIFLIEVLDNSYRSLEHLEGAAGINPLGIVPEIGDGKYSRKTLFGKNKSRANLNKKERAIMRRIAHYAYTEPTSSFAEAVRNITVGMALSNVDAPPKVVMVTSAEPGEGKTIFNYSLGLIQAAAGKKTLVIDCDLRKPSLHTLLDINRTPGIVDYLKGDATIKDILHKSDETGLYYIPAGSATKQSANLLQSQKFAELLELLKREFDFISIDSPPLLAVTDSNILATKVDGVLFAVRWGWTRRNLVREAVRRLEKNDITILGAMLTRVNMKHLARYGYGDSNYYYSGYADYYTTPSNR